MSYPYGAPGGGYPQQGQGGYPQQGGYPGMPQPGGAGGFAQPGAGMPQPGGGMPQPGGGMPQPGGGMPQPGGGYPQQYPQQGYPQQPQVGMPTPDSASGAYGAGAPGGLPYAMNPPATGFGGAGGPPAPGYGQMYGQPGGGMPAGTGGYAQQQTPQPAYPGGQPQSASYNTPQPAAAPYNPQQQHTPQQPQGNVQGSGAQVSANYASSGKASTGYKQPADPTIKPYPGFNAEDDSKKLRKAMKGFGTDEKAIIDILGYRSNGQRQQIKVMYKTMFGRDLIADLKSELSGKFEDIIIGVMMKPEEFDAYELRRAMKGVGTDESAMIEILCTRNNNQLREIIQTYKVLYGRNLEKDIASETSGHFKKLMISMVAGGRMEDQQVSVNKAAQDAQSLHQAGVKRLGTDESVFNSIIASQSYEQLRAVFDAYNKVAGHDITRAIANEFSGDIQTGLLTIVNCVRSKTVYFADRLYHSMKGLGTDDRTLIRVVVTRSEVDMVQIKQEFQRKYKQTLEQFVQSDVSGDYRRFILALVSGSC